MDAKWYAGSQVIDEVRHVEVFSKFLHRKMGVIHPDRSDAEGAARSAPRRADLEDEGARHADAVRGHGRRHHGSREAREHEPAHRRHHHARSPGRGASRGIRHLSMRRIVQESTPEEMHEMEDFAFNILETLNANQQLDMLRMFGHKYDLDPDNVVQMMHSLEQWGFINSEPFMHTVIPNLKRLGLITERTEQKYRDRGILFDAQPAMGHASAFPIAS
jgi:hypothetical protein